MEKAYRVKKNEEYQYIFKNGKSFANRQLVRSYIEDNDQTLLRSGLSVWKKIGNAVMRNRIKRCLRRAFTDLKKEVKPGYDLIIIARQPTKEMNCHMIKKSLIHSLKREQLL